MLERRGVITDDIERVEGGETFFWQGHYEYDMNVAHTDDTQLNVFADFDPKLSEAARQAQMLFLGNIQPELQQRVRARAAARPSSRALDSMNLWIETERDALVKRDRRGRLPAAQRRRDPRAHRRAQPRARRPGRDGDGPGRDRRQARRVRRGPLLPRRVLRDPRLPARGRPRPDRRRRQLRRRLPRLPRQPPRRGRLAARPRRPAPGDGLRLGARLVQRRGLRHRAGQVTDQGRDRRAPPRLPADHPLRRPEPARR